MTRQYKKGTLQFLMEKIPDVNPRDIAHAIGLAMNKSGISKTEHTATSAVKWACSHVEKVKRELKDEASK